jgi:ribosome biogenesis GTPase / thiamine phosphate phosphatase
MSPREYDESDARIRPSRTTRRRSKDRPTHSDSVTAFVTTVDRGRTTCVTDSGTVITAMKARELGPKSVVVGDFVEVVGDLSGAEGSLARIVSVNDRSNSLSRTVDDVARVERTIVANIDQLMIVVAATNPEPRRGLIDRFLVSAFHESITPIILVTKVDLAPIPEFFSEYRALGVEIITTSSKLNSRAEEIAAIKDLLAEKISVLVGHSGVGKSTLINDLVDSAARATGDVNDVTGRGRHTSSSAIALPLVGGGWIIDTPGIRAFGLSHLDKNRIIEAFPDIYQVTQKCMPNCSHHEVSCALNAWIESDAAAKDERLMRVTSLQSLLEVKPGDEQR